MPVHFISCHVIRVACAQGTARPEVGDGAGGLQIRGLTQVDATKAHPHACMYVYVCMFVYACRLI
jgi:hypothetical protein